MSDIYERPKIPTPLTMKEREGSIAILDAEGRTVCVLYFREDPNSARVAGVLTLREARRMAKTILRLPDLLKES